MRKNNLHSLLAGFLPLALGVVLCLAVPAHAGGNSQGGNNNSQGGNNQGYQGRPAGPAIPEPSGWLALGVGLLVAAPYLRSRGRRDR